MQHGAGQRSPYQDFLQKCGANLEQLGYGGQVTSPSSSPSYKHSKTYNNPRNSPRGYGGQENQSSEQRRDQYSQGEKRQDKQQPKGNKQPNQHWQQDGQPGSKTDNRRKSQGANKTRRKQVKIYPGLLNMKMFIIVLCFLLSLQVSYAYIFLHF